MGNYGPYWRKLIELLSLIGSAGSGKLLGLASDFIQNRTHEKAEREEREFQKDLAFKGQLNDYMQAQHRPIDGKTSLLSVTLCAMYIMFAFTACAACLYCFYLAFGEVVIKDPDATQGGWNFIGIIDWKFAPKNISQLSPLGVGYLILHPILFILSMVSTGSRAKKG